MKWIPLVMMEILLPQLRILSKYKNKKGELYPEKVRAPFFYTKNVKKNVNITFAITEEMIKYKMWLESLKQDGGISMFGRKQKTKEAQIEKYQEQIHGLERKLNRSHSAFMEALIHNKKPGEEDIYYHNKYYQEIEEIRKKIQELTGEDGEQ